MVQNNFTEGTSLAYTEINKNTNVLRYNLLKVKSEFARSPDKYMPCYSFKLFQLVRNVWTMQIRSLELILDGSADRTN